MRLSKINLTAAFAFLSIVNIAKSQHKCGSDMHYDRILQEHPEAKLLEDQMNAEADSKKVESRAAIYTIPVVFHVIHTNGAENISRDQILDQMRVLNEDFNLLNSNRNKLRSAFAGLAADCQIKFELAKIDPNGNCTDGINRVYSSAGVQMDMATEPVKSLIIWPYTKYLNIWVVSSIDGGTSGGEILGYAVFPWTAKFSKDGIVMKSDRVGTIGTAVASDSGRTLTHEVGHWLGLYHVFQDDCDNGDKVDDTPPATGPFTNANCPAAGNSCSTDSPDKLDLWEDYMDYSNGSCQCLFTKLQKTRMHSYLTSGTSPRTTNVSTSNLIATGITPSSVAPVATFTSSAQVICAGQSVKFYDLSCKSLPTAWSWTFTGSSQPSASTQNPTVTYQTPGVYPVSLTVQNTKGSNSVTKSSYITVLKAAGANKPNFEQGFENGDPAAFTTSDKFVHSSPTTSRFTLETTVGYTGSNCYKAPIATGSAAGSTYSITLPSFDISGMGASTPRFTFYSSYAQPDATVTEVMRVYVSTDCGASFKQILERSGAALAYSGQVYTNNFKPTKSTNWRLSGVTSLSSIGYGLNQNLTFRIDVISGGGNPVYIDNINIGAFYAGVNTIGKDLMGFEVNPNPIEANSKIVIHSAITDEEVTVVLLDLQGRKVANIFSGKILESNTTLYMSDLLLPSSGLYVISMESSKGSIQKPVIFGK